MKERRGGEEREREENGKKKTDVTMPRDRTQCVARPALLISTLLQLHVHISHRIYAKIIIKCWDSCPLPMGTLKETFGVD